MLNTTCFEFGFDISSVDKGVLPENFDPKHLLSVLKRTVHCTMKIYNLI
jgi:hypothetical protein